VGEFFLCRSEGERVRWLAMLIATGRVGRRARSRGDLHRLVDVLELEKLEHGADSPDDERAVDPLRLYCTSSARQPRGWAWAPPTMIARARRILRDRGARALALRVLARLRSQAFVAVPGASPSGSQPRTHEPDVPLPLEFAESIGDLHRILFARGIVGAEPRFIDLEIDISNRCNIRCRMCYFSFDQTFHAQAVFMRPGAFASIADSILPHAKTLMLSLGSEPLMSPDFVRVLELAARYRVPELGFYTNGLLMNDRIVDAIIESGVTVVAISVDGATKTTFESIRKGANFELLLRNVRALVRRRAEHGGALPRVRFGVVLMRQNIEELPDIVTLAWRLGVEELNFFHAVVYDGLDTEPESLVHHKALSNDCLARARARAHELGLTIVHNPSPFKLDAAPAAIPQPPRAARTTDPYCRFPFFHVSIDSGGRVMPCPFAHGEPSFGVVGPDTPFERIWLGQAFTELRRRILTNDPPDMCRRCSFLASSQPDRPELFGTRPN
jgi:MoaA/NifB/PqqE/SkfB family radical SAM enzyme